MRELSKNQEIEILDKTIKELGPNSYLGPWLSTVRLEVIRDITSDYNPVPSYDYFRATAENCRQLVSEAKTEAVKIICDAREKATQESEKIKENLYDALQKARRALDY